MKIVIIDLQFPDVIKEAGRLAAFVETLKDNHEITTWSLGEKAESSLAASLGLDYEAALVLDRDACSYPEVICEVLQTYLNEHPVDLILFYGNSMGHGLATRLAFQLGMDYQPQVDYLRLDEGLQAVRKICNSHLDGYFELSLPAVVSVSKTGPSQAVAEACTGEPGEEVSVQAEYEGYLLDEVRTPKTDGGALAEAELVFIGGKGLGSKENYERLRAIAQKRGGACGGTRLAALSGYCPTADIVGQSGAVLTAGTCIVIGASGAAPLMAGLGNVETIIGINKDPDAPLFDGVDYGIVGEAEDFLMAWEVENEIY